MKLITLIRQYLKGIRLLSFVLAVMMTVSLSLCILTYAGIRYNIFEYDLVNSADVENAYYVGTIITPVDLEEKTIDEISLEKEAQIEQMREADGVENVFAIWNVNPITYNGEGISILLYEPEMLEFFPGFKDIGIDFSKNPDGCILGSKIFNGVDVGENIELTFYQPEEHTESFEVVGHIGAPYHIMSFGGAGNIVNIRHMFKTNPIILMQYSEERMAHFRTTASVFSDINYITVFEDGVTPEEQAEILSTYAGDALPQSLTATLEASAETISSELKTELPRPLFLLFSATVAYLSTLVLTFKKKEKELAVDYLCGCSKKRCGVITFCAFNLIAVVPILLNILVVLIVPELDWRGQIDLTSMMMGDQMFLLVLGYYLITAAIAVVVTIGSMAKHTPLTYLRGATQ